MSQHPCSCHEHLYSCEAPLQQLSRAPLSRAPLQLRSTSAAVTSTYVATVLLQSDSSCPIACPAFLAGSRSPASLAKGRLDLLFLHLARVTCMTGQRVACQ